MWSLKANCCWSIKTLNKLSERCYTLTVLHHEYIHTSLAYIKTVKFPKNLVHISVEAALDHS